MIRTTLTALALAFAAVAPATASEGLTPGFWIFPAEPAASEAELADLCTHGMSLVQADGSWFSYLAEGERLIVDAEGVCTQADGLTSCAVHIYGPDGAVTAQSHASRYSRDAAGHLMARLEVDGVPLRASYPQQCPPSAVRDLMVGWLAP